MKSLEFGERESILWQTNGSVLAEKIAEKSRRNMDSWEERRREGARWVTTLKDMRGKGKSQAKSAARSGDGWGGGYSGLALKIGGDGGENGGDW